jgi:hypothetical protein
VWQMLGNWKLEIGKSLEIRKVRGVFIVLVILVFIGEREILFVVCQKVGL